MLHNLQAGRWLGTFVLAACTFFSGNAQESSPKQEIVPIVLPSFEQASYDDWISIELPLWKGTAVFPDTPYYSVKEIYTEKGLVPEQYFKWEDRNQTILLEVSSYKLPEKLTDKTEKKLLDAVAQRFAIIHGGYPELSSGVTLTTGIRSFDLDIRTLKKQQFRAKIFMQGEQVMIVSVLIMQSTPEVRLEAAHFLKSIDFNPLPGEIQKDLTPDKKGIFAKPSKEETPWEVLEVEQFSIAFPKYPVGQHKLVSDKDQSVRYYQWHMADADNGISYILALTPVTSWDKDWRKAVENGVQATMQATGSYLLQEKDLDFFFHPGKEVLLKSKQQVFRVRYFCDGQYLYQLVISGLETDVYSPSANKFMDGLVWR
jgi:hypothetical protein